MTSKIQSPSAEILFVGNSMLIEVRGLAAAASGAFQNAATVTVTLKDVNDTPLTGETWPLALTYITSSQGNYRATLADTLPIAEGGRYTATVIANAGAGLRARWDVPCYGMNRT